MFAAKALPLLIALVYAIAVILALVTSLQALKLRSTMSTLRDAALVNNTPSPGSLHDSGTGSVRAYSMICDAQASTHASSAMQPAFHLDLAESCPGHGGTSSAHLRATQRSFASPRWLVLHATRGARSLHDDVMNGRVDTILITGHPCRVRVASPAELDKLASVLAGATHRAGALRVLAFSDERDVSAAAADGSGCTVPPRDFALASTSASSWPDFLNAGSSTLLMHVWGYGTRH